jgi:pseudoazurin
MRLVMAVMVGLAATPAAAETVEVKMLNMGPNGTPMVFEPASVEIDPGDTVHFKAVDKSHNVQSLNGMIPEGAESFRGGINQSIKVTFEKNGTYAYKCLPHVYTGMVGVVKVGDWQKNVEHVRAKVSELPKKARERMRPLLDGE